LSGCWLSPDDNILLDRAKKRKEQLVYDTDFTNARLNEIRGTDHAENTPAKLSKTHSTFAVLSGWLNSRPNINCNGISWSKITSRFEQIEQGTNAMIYTKGGVEKEVE